MIITFVILANYYKSILGVEAFQANPLPHQDPFGWLNGKYKSKNVVNGHCLPHPPSRFELETLHRIKQMCADLADENESVMSYKDAYNLITETYPGCFCLEVSKNCKILD